MLPDLSKDPTQWFPMPAALVTCQPPNGRPNLMGIGYVGFCCWQPPTVCLGINTARYSGEVIRAVKTFVVALPDEEHVLNMDYCGFISGIDRDKFAAAGFTTRPAKRITAPLINECPVNLECELTSVTAVGSHDLYLGRVVETHVDPRYMTGRESLRPIILVSRRYVAADHFVSDFGASEGAPPAEASYMNGSQAPANAVPTQERNA